jgi:hypothetical protein
VIFAGEEVNTPKIIKRISREAVYREKIQKKRHHPAWQTEGE